MKTHRKVLNKKMYAFSLLLFMFYTFMTVAIGLYTYDSYTKYGLYYNSVVETLVSSNFFLNASLTVVMSVTAIVLLASASYNVVTLVNDPKKGGSSSYGIDFPNVRPESWDISVNMETQCLEVTLDDNTVSISKETIDNLFKGEVRKS